MYTETMSEKEIHERMFVDLNKMNVTCFGSIGRDFTQIIRKSKKFPVRKTYNYETNGTQYSMVCVSVGSMDTIDFGFDGSIYSTYNTKDGVYAICSLPTSIEKISKKTNSTFKFYPHLFKRFAERENLDMHGKELIKEFFRTNHVFNLVSNYDRNDNSFYMFTNEGVICGYFHAERDGKNGYLLNAKTYISYKDMTVNKSESSKVSRNCFDLAALCRSASTRKDISYAFSRLNELLEECKDEE